MISQRKARCFQFHTRNVVGTTQNILLDIFYKTLVSSSLSHFRYGIEIQIWLDSFHEQFHLAVEFKVNRIESDANAIEMATNVESERMYNTD